MKSVTLFFNKLTIGKGLLLSLSPVLIILLSMKTALLALGIIIVIDMITGIRKDLHHKSVPFSLFKKMFCIQVARHTRPEGHFKVWATIN